MIDFSKFCIIYFQKIGRLIEKMNKEEDHFLVFYLFKTSEVKILLITEVSDLVKVCSYFLDISYQSQRVP